MMKKALAFSALIIASLATQGVYARGGANGVMLTANVFMHNETAQLNSGAKSERKSSYYDLKLGYLTGSGLYLGGIYSIAKYDDGTNKEDGKALGGSIGYVGASGFFIKGHYIASAESEDLKEGTGVQADLGYLANVAGPLVVGVELSYRSIEYKKNDTIPGFEKYKQEDLFPMLTVGFIF